ncbi:MAG: PAS domain S-box protein, partial [Chloroflexi bacterium]|nr:PAS domain S-box protein [Chloroflexota bacterium]
MNAGPLCNGAERPASAASTTFACNDRALALGTQRYPEGYVSFYGTSGMLSSLREQDQLIRRRVVELASGAWASFLAGFAVHPTAGDNDPSVRWPLLSFRWGLTAAYVCIILLTRPGQKPEWVIATIGYLVIYHLATTLHTTVHMRRGRPVTWFWEAIPFADIVAVSLIIATVSSVTFPVWALYFLIVFGASMSRGGSYILTLTAACMLGYAGAVASHLASAQQVPWSDVIIIVILMAFGGLFGNLRASFERVLYQDLNESESRYRDLYEDAPNAYFSVGVDARIRTANRAAEELLGYTPDELVGKPVFDLYADTPTGKAKARKVFSRFLAGEEALGEELEMRRADGRHLWISLTARALRDAEGQIEETRSVVVDITERRQAQQALQESEERYRDLFENASDLVQIVALDGSLMYVNRAWREALGYSEEEIPGLSLLDIIHPDARAECSEMFQKVMTGEKRERVEFTFLA